MNFRKWTSALTLCAVTLTATAMPAFANDTAYVEDGIVEDVNGSNNDTAIVGPAESPNLQAACDAMAAAMAQLNGGGANSGSNGSAQDPSTGDTDTLGYDYVSLENPATIIDGQVYLPLRATFGAMKDAALSVEWKPEGQQKIQLNGEGVSYEVYLTADGNGLQLEQGGTTYSLKNVDSVTYVPLTFFQAIIQTANVGLSGDKILVLESKSGDSVWADTASFWGNMNDYQAPVQEPDPEPETPEVTPTPTPEPEKPEITYPDAQEPAPTPDPTPEKPDNGNSGNNGNGSGIIGKDNLMWPANSTYITSDYGYRIDPVGGIVSDFHLGVDIAGSTGDPVYAAAGGTVIRASWFSSYGNCIDIQHPSGLVTRYAHLSAYHVSVGDTVTQGQVIADIGATGNVTGPHLHFETLIGGTEVDPANYFDFLP